MTLEKLLSDIRQNWDTVLAPNVDRKKWDHALAQEFPGYTIVNWTDFNYGKSHSYQILLPRGQWTVPGSLEEERNVLSQIGGEQRSILFKLSAIAPYYLLKILSRKLESGGQIGETVSDPKSNEEVELTRRCTQFAQRNGYLELPRQFLEAHVPGAELELAEPGTVTIYNCLFEDQSNHVPLPF